MLVPVLLEERQLLLVEGCGPRVVALHLRHESKRSERDGDVKRVAHPQLRQPASSSVAACSSMAPIQGQEAKTSHRLRLAPPVA